jgi:molecular chaperone IbpA
MNSFDFSPLFRSAIGFDRLARTLEAARVPAEPQGYPPYNIEKTSDDIYSLTLAVAGFGPEDIEVVVKENVLSIAGRAPKAEDGGRFLHRGIAGRAFERRFVLADHLLVDTARLEHGLLYLTLRQVVPEALKPRQIPVLGGQPRQVEANEQTVTAAAA